MLKETFGRKGLNIKIESNEGAQKICDGFLVDDNVVHV
jgi:hypothetical protein